MTDYLPPRKEFAQQQSVGKTGTSDSPGKHQPTQQEINAILARVEKEQRTTLASETKSFDRTFSVLFRHGFMARMLFAMSGLILINNGIDGLMTRAESPTSLIAGNINNRGGQSVGLGFAMLAFSFMPYPSRKNE